MSLNELINKALKDDKFKAELKQNPKKVIEKESNVKLDDNIEIKVVEETETLKYLVIPYVSTDEALSDEMLQAVAGGVGKLGAVKRRRDEAEQARREVLDRLNLQ